MENEFDIRYTQIIVQMILPNGEAEKATDDGGVLRDALSEYWETFYMQRTTGDQLKVPALLHAIHRNRWDRLLSRKVPTSSIGIMFPGVCTKWRQCIQRTFGVSIFEIFTGE